jgi:thiamine biosynthesis lipoprotein
MSAERITFTALGSSCHLFVVGRERSRLAAGRAWIEEMHRRLTRFEPESELSTFNRSAGAWIDVSAELEVLLRTSLWAYEASDGLVNVAVLRSLLAIGYTRTFSAGPTLATQQAAPAPALPEVLEVRRGQARLRPGEGIDLGGIAKGWLADRLCERLGPNSLANLGGDLFARGAGPEGAGWPVGVGGVTVMLEDMGAATSGTWRRRWGDAHHLIDPRTGWPSRSPISQVSVVAASALEAEVQAKAVLLRGPAPARPQPGSATHRN